MLKDNRYGRCPYCMSQSLIFVSQNWSFKDDLGRNCINPKIEITMICDACEKRSTWRWVERD